MANTKTKTYGTVAVDPPWPTNQRGNYGAINHYPLMTLDEISKLPIGELTADNAHCWLWVTNGTMKIGHEILEGWGFTPRSIFTWLKPRMGLGVYLRSFTEHVILATKGKSPILFKAQPNWGFFPLQDHSHKPEEIFSIIERCSPGPYLEMFARRENPLGWDIWGNEVLSDIDIPGYPVPRVKGKEAV